MIRYIDEGAIVAPTPLCELMKENGSDKGGINAAHNYTTYYYSLFNTIRNTVTSVFELGLGTTDPSIQSNMGQNGVPGASLRAWKSFFPNATVYGADIDKKILWNEERLFTFYCDQTDPDEIKGLWNKIPVEFDIIIEDGLHEFDANVCFLENSLHKLKVGGYYIIEDIVRRHTHKYLYKLSEWEQKYTNFSFEMIELQYSINSWDNTLIVVKRLN